jgi:cytochrome c biogenesis protein CcmG/thiol:disulfide interchange protein DsbE
MNRSLLFIPLGIFVLMAVVFWIGLGQEDKTSLPSPLIDHPFPEFSLTVLEDSRAVTKADIVGAPALVNVWATWCPTCKHEHTFLNELASQGVRIFGINYKDNDEKAKDWLMSFGNPYIWNLSDPNGQLGLELGVYGAPETFLVDSKGIIRAKHIGDLNPKVWQTLKLQFEAME